MLEDGREMGGAGTDQGDEEGGRSSTNVQGGGMEGQGVARIGPGGRLYVKEESAGGGAEWAWKWVVRWRRGGGARGGRQEVGWTI